SGVGTIGLYIANKAKEVIGIESNVAAVNNAKENAELNNISNCRFHADLVENKIAEICQEKNIDAIVFDPPRKGLEESIIELVGKKKIAKIIYISCNPMTQKRDIDNFIKIGYRIKKIQPFDMFPQTWHIENVIELSYEN
ncbi:MAG: class I SAM-dependent RNA methyltransferase, partial [Candidatus Cloacimonetes bacterium]|nr:class I SAM-dependent RNA methyltransferase [Candidatus Cloacimonadota bacterium]